MRRPAATFIAFLLTACATPAHTAENLAARVAAAPDGTVGFAYPARASVCGDGRSFIVEHFGPGQQAVYTAEGTNFTSTFNGNFLDRCVPGPVRILLTVRSGKVIDLQPYVGGSARAVRTDLGTVTAQEAADFLIDTGRRRPELANYAFMAASLGEGARISLALLEHARDLSTDADMRESAVKWIGRTAEREATVARVLPGLRAITQNRNEQVDVRERAVRAIGEFSRGDAELRSMYAALDAPTLRERALRVFAEVGGPANSEFVERVALDAREHLEVRDRAVRLLGDELGNSAAIRALYGRLDHAELRARAVRSIAEHLNSESAGWVRSVAENTNEDHSIRDRAIRTLAEGGYVQQVRALYARLNDDELQDRVIRVVAEHGSADDQRWIEQIATNANEAESLRDRALRVMAEHGLASQRMATLYDQISSYELKERLLKLMGERSDDASIEKLIAVARNETDSDLRRRAAKLLSESDHPRAREFLRTAVLNR
jgi:hypothetical protein